MTLGVCSAVTFMPATTSIRDCINAVGSTSYAMCMSLLEDWPDDEPLRTWASCVKTIYEQAVAWAEQGPDTALSPRQQQQARAAQQHAFEQQLWQLCQPYVRTAAPQHTLCERVERFLPELFVFVAVPGVPAHNDVMAYCTPCAWLACLLKLTFILVMRV